MYGFSGRNGMSYMEIAKFSGNQCGSFYNLLSVSRIYISADMVAKCL